MGRPGKSRFQRQQRAQARQRSEQEFSSVPHSFVFPRGRAGRSLRSLSKDLRRVLEPFTARNLQVRRSNSLRDLVAVAGPLGVTQFLVLSKSQTGVNLKIFRLPGGPTLTFKVLQYSLVRDVVSALRRHRMHEQQFLHPPLLVLGNFGARARPELRLMAGMFQGMFPALNVHKVNLNSIRRCLLISYDADSQLLEFRHYSVQVVPVGLSRGLRKILQEKFPNLARMDDVSQLLTGDVVLSESEAEPDGSQNVLELPQNCAGRGNAVTQQSAIRLTEIGPRLTLQLLKVEEGLGQGNVLYHGLAPKGEAELQELLARRERRLQVRAERRRQQEQNLERKRQQRELHRQRSLAGMGVAPGGPGAAPGDAGGDSGAEDPGAPEAGEAEDEDEAEYYRQELGAEPDPDLFPGSSKRKRSPSAAPRARKRRKGTPKSTPGTPKSTPGTPKSTPGTPKSTPGTPKSHRKNPKSTPGTPKSTPGTPKSTPGSQKFHPKPPKSHRKNPKSTPGTPKSTPASQKFHPKTPKFHTGNGAVLLRGLRADTAPAPPAPPATPAPARGAHPPLAERLRTLRLELAYLRAVDVKILQQLVVVNEGIEAVKWLLEERSTLTSRCSSLASSQYSLVESQEASRRGSWDSLQDPNDRLDSISVGSYLDTLADDMDEYSHNAAESAAAATSGRAPARAEQDWVRIDLERGLAKQEKDTEEHEWPHVDLSPPGLPQDHRFAKEPQVANGYLGQQSPSLEPDRDTKSPPGARERLGKGNPDGKAWKAEADLENCKLNSKLHLEYDAHWRWLQSQDDVTFL